MHFVFGIRNVLAWLRQRHILIVIAVSAMTICISTILMGMVAGMHTTILATAGPRNIIATRVGSRTETTSVVKLAELDALTEVANSGNNGQPQALISPELDDQVFFERKSGGSGNLVVRGILPIALQVHDQLHFVEGRALRPGSGEIVVGINVARHFRNAKPGDVLRFGKREWHVVGVFSAAGSSFESEVWCDLGQLFKDTRSPFYNCISMQLAPGVDEDRFIRQLAATPALAKIRFLPEEDYLREQAVVVQQLSMPSMLAIIVLSTSAIIVIGFAMLSTLQRRQGELRTLGAIGFSRRSIETMLWLETASACLIGGIAGLLIGFLLNGITVSFSSFMTYSTLLFSINMSSSVAAIAVLTALCLGSLAGFIPARSFARSERTAEAAFSCNYLTSKL